MGVVRKLLRDQLARVGGFEYFVAMQDQDKIDSAIRLDDIIANAMRRFQLTNGTALNQYTSAVVGTSGIGFGLLVKLRKSVVGLGSHSGTLKWSWQGSLENSLTRCNV